MKTCLVCNDQNGQMHYGAVCCPSCKGFFRRVYVSDRILECYQGNSCKITLGTRNRCRACRFKKCLQVGMNPKDIKDKIVIKSANSSDEDTKIKEEENTKPKSMNSNRHMIIMEDVSNADNDDVVFTTSHLPVNNGVSGQPGSSYQHDSPYQPQGYDDSLFNVDVMAKSDNNGHTQDPSMLITSLLKLERFCENPTVTASVTPEEEDALIEQMMSFPVKSLVEKTCPQCPRFQMIWKPNAIVNIDNFKKSWARHIVSALDWANHFSLFAGLDAKDKERVFVHNVTQVILFTMVYHTYKQSCCGILLGNSNVCPFKTSVDRDTRKHYLKYQLHFLHSPLVYASFTDYEALFETHYRFYRSEEGWEIRFKDFKTPPPVIGDEEDIPDPLEDNNVSTILSKVVERLVPDVLAVMMRTQMTEEDFVLLKARLFLNAGMAGMQISKKGLEELRDAQTRLKETLRWKLRTDNSRLDEFMMKTVEYQGIVSRLQDIQKIFDEGMTTFLTFEDGEEKMFLLHDLHRHKNKLSFLDGVSKDASTST